MTDNVPANRTDGPAKHGTAQAADAASGAASPESAGSGAL